MAFVNPNYPWDDDDVDGEDVVKLLSAPQDGLSADEVLSILNKNPRLIRFADPVGDTVLHMSARNGDVDQVNKLIKFLNERRDDYLAAVLGDENVNGDTPSHLARKNGHPKVSDQLNNAENGWGFQRDSDWIASDPDFLASRSPSNQAPSCTDLSLQADVEMKAVWTELSKAINNGKEVDLSTRPVAEGEKLLRHQNYIGKTLLHSAARGDGQGPLMKIVHFMISNGMTDVALLADIYGKTPLHDALERNKLSHAQCLIKAEPRAVYQVDRNGVSPLYMAVKEGHKDLIEYMASHCCLRDAAPEILRHPIHAMLAHLAVKTRSIDTLKLLMERIPELVKVTDEKGWRPLSYAASTGYLAGVTYFLTNFPEAADKRDKDGSFPIHKAIGGGHVSVIKEFNKHCPQTLHHIDPKGRSVLHIAASYGKADILTYLTKELKMDDSFSSLKDNLGKTFMDYGVELKN